MTARSVDRTSDRFVQRRRFLQRLDSFNQIQPDGPSANAKLLAQRFAPHNAGGVFEIVCRVKNDFRAFFKAFGDFRFGNVAMPDLNRTDLLWALRYSR